MVSRFYALAFVLGLASFEVSANSNLVVNGDFETGDSLGWTTSGSNLEWISSPYQGTARQGNYAWQYDAYPNNPAFINQTLNTIAGTKYTLSFDTMVYGGSPNNFSISVGGSLLYSFNNSPDYSWKTDVIYFTATSDVEVLSVGGASGPLWVEVDNVSVTVAAVPEPSALSLLAVGLGGLAVIRRRRS